MEPIVEHAKPTVPYLMALNRKERRRLGKVNNIRIPGSAVPVVNPKNK